MPSMVDISAKAATSRTATAAAVIRFPPEAALQLSFDTSTGPNQDIVTSKGPVGATAVIAGTMACKKTSDLIPFCHPIPVEDCNFDVGPVSDDGMLEIHATVTTSGKTGVEMEAMTAVSVAALTIYDMTKSLTKGIVISEVRLLSKTGGKSGHWRHTDA